jgi:hypothetical protein
MFGRDCKGVIAESSRAPQTLEGTMKCAMCDKSTTSHTEIPFMKIWKRHHEWTTLPRRGIVCRGCLKWVQSGGFRDVQLWCEPMPHIVGPQRYEGPPESIVIAIFDSQLIGLRCAKWRYGVDMVNEVIQGFYYEDERGNQVIRVTADSGASEDQRCTQCYLSLWACNAMEVIV